jgi:hypothetical protein
LNLASCWLMLDHERFRDYKGFVYHLVFVRSVIQVILYKMVFEQTGMI